MELLQLVGLPASLHFFPPGFEPRCHFLSAAFAGLDDIVPLGDRREPVDCGAMFLPRGEKTMGFGAKLDVGQSQPFLAHTEEPHGIIRHRSLRLIEQRIAQLDELSRDVKPFRISRVTPEEKRGRGSGRPLVHQFDIPSQRFGRCTVTGRKKLIQVRFPIAVRVPERPCQQVGS